MEVNSSRWVYIISLRSLSAGVHTPKVLQKWTGSSDICTLAEKTAIVMSACLLTESVVCLAFKGNPSSLFRPCLKGRWLYGW